MDFEQVGVLVGLTPRQEEEYKLFYKSAISHYKPLYTSYVRRNISFFIQRTQETLEHSKEPQKDPAGFGLGLGTFIALLQKAKEPMIAKEILKENNANKLKEITGLLNNIKGFPEEFIKEKLNEINTATLNDSELKQYDFLTYRSLSQ